MTTRTDATTRATRQENESMESVLQSLLPEGWDTDGYGLDCLLICPCGYTIEQDGSCPEGCVSPLVELGMI